MYRRILLGLALAGLVLTTYSILRPREPAPELIRLAVRATLHAMPTSTPYFVEVTRVVEVTATPSPTGTATLLPAATDTPEQTETAGVAPADTPSPEPVAFAAAAPAVPVRAAGDAAIVSPDLAEPESAAPEPVEPVPVEPVPVEPVPIEPVPIESESVAPEAAALESTAYVAGPGCPTSSGRTYSLIPVEGGGLDHPHDQHGDLNLALRGYNPVGTVTALVEINGPTDGDAPQIGAVLPGSPSQLVSVYQVNQWDWGCGDHGCRGGGPVGAEVSMVGLAASPGAPVSIPSRGAEIYGGGFVALVLYAEESRLTLVYTREDSVANGYSARHRECVCGPRVAQRIPRRKSGG